MGGGKTQRKISGCLGVEERKRARGAEGGGGKRERDREAERAGRGLKKVWMVV